MNPRCRLCEFIGTYETDLQNHIHGTHSDSLFTCKTCQFTCTSEAELERHMVSYHSNYHRTRIYSSRSQQSTIPVIKQPGVFRPWSGNHEVRRDTPPNPPAYAPSNASVRSPFSNATNQHVRNKD